jgi:hypothetical protein
MQIYLPPRCFSLIVFLMAFLALSFPFVVLAQDDVGQARIDAERDAQSNVNGTLWLLIGCVASPFFAYLSTPSPPAIALLNKSPEYVAVYSDTYRAKAKSIQQSKAWTGCIIGGLAYVACYVVIIAAAASTE